MDDLTQLTLISCERGGWPIDQPSAMVRTILRRRAVDILRKRLGRKRHSPRRLHHLCPYCRQPCRYLAHWACRWAARADDTIRCRYCNRPLRRRKRASAKGQPTAHRACHMKERHRRARMKPPPR